MTDTQTPAAPAADSLRNMSILIYALYLGAFVNGITAVIAVILAYVKRDDARGTVYESHMANAIETFWISLVLCIVGGVTVFIGIGFFILIGACVFYLYRTIKGLVRVVDNQPYA